MLRLTLIRGGRRDALERPVLGLMTVTFADPTNPHCFYCVVASPDGRRGRVFRMWGGQALERDGTRAIKGAFVEPLAEVAPGSPALLPYATRGGEAAQILVESVAFDAATPPVVRGATA